MSFFHRIGARERGDRSSRSIKQKVFEHPSLPRRMGSVTRLENHEGYVNAVDWNETGELLITAGDDKKVSLWRPHARKQLLLEFNTGHRGNIFGIRFLPSDDALIASCSQDNTVRVHRLGPSGTRCTLVLRAHTDHVNDIQAHPNAPKLLWSASSDGSIRCFDLREGSGFGSWFVDAGIVTELGGPWGGRGFEPGRYADWKGGDLLACEVDVETRSVFAWPSTSEGIFSIALHPINDNYLLSGGCGKYIRMFDRRMPPKRVPGDHGYVAKFCPPNIPSQSQITSVSINHDGTKCLASYSSNDIYLMNLCKSQRMTFASHIHANTSLSYSMPPKYSKDFSDELKRNSTGGAVRPLTESSDGGPPSKRLRGRPSVSAETKGAPCPATTNSSHENPDSPAANTRGATGTGMNDSERDEPNDGNEVKQTLGSAEHMLRNVEIQCTIEQGIRDFVQSKYRKAIRSLTRAIVLARGLEECSIETRASLYFRRSQAKYRAISEEKDVGIIRTSHLRLLKSALKDSERACYLAATNGFSDQTRAEMRFSRAYLLFHLRRFQEAVDELRALRTLPLPDTFSREALEDFEAVAQSALTTSLSSPLEFSAGDNSLNDTAPVTTSHTASVTSGENVGTFSPSSSDIEDLEDEEEIAARELDSRLCNPDEKKNSTQSHFPGNSMRQNGGNRNGNSGSSLLYINRGRGTYPRHQFRWDVSRRRTPLMRFSGHSNVQSLKNVTFWGQHSEFVISGSDDSRIFIWQATTGNIVRVIETKDAIVDIIRPHPTDPAFVSTGAKGVSIWEPYDGSAKEWKDVSLRLSAIISENKRIHDASGAGHTLTHSQLRALMHEQDGRCAMQ
mmetsp:Transcript_11672/g.16318  ORF Transcript_11672/g.16318 Transcript_11672/m.16318 type:complete len:846 (+) Transcript_11672:151-2688(+)